MGQLDDPSTPLDLEVICINSIYLLLGVYGWEFLHSLQVEGALISGRLSFRPPLIPYILGRISLLVFLVLLAVGTSPYTKGIDCLPGALTISSLGAIALGCSSTNFMIRTWVIWKNSRLVHALLFLLALGQWTLLVLDVGIIKVINTNDVCDVHPSFRQVDAVTFIYITAFDLLVLVLSVAGLSTQQSTSSLKRRLRAQGVLYVAIAGISYIPPMVAALLNYTPVFNLVSNVAITTSTMASSWAVRSLLFLETYDSNHESEVALTTQIGVQRTIVVQEGAPACGQHSADGPDQC